MKTGVRTFSNTAGRFGMVIIMTAMVGAGVSTAIAQQATGFSRSGTYYVDGSNPVDAQTRELVDIYMEQRRTRELEEARRRNGVILFQYHGNTSIDQQLSRF